jgi:hypothetical protein
MDKAAYLARLPAWLMVEPARAARLQHSELIKMHYDDFERLAHPPVVSRTTYEFQFGAQSLVKISIDSPASASSPFYPPTLVPLSALDRGWTLEHGSIKVREA